MEALDYEAVIDGPGCALGVHCDAEHIIAIAFLPPATPRLAPRNTLAAQACIDLAAYLADPRHSFELPLKPAGTTFQCRVWSAIAAIPCGQTRSYGEIAHALHSAPRAIGQACGANPYPLVVPCHRVVGSSELGGFAHARGGFLLEAKRWLLHHEEAV